MPGCLNTAATSAATISALFTSRNLMSGDFILRPPV
jgi:hypothetical protein